MHVLRILRKHFLIRLFRSNTEHVLRILKKSHLSSVSSSAHSMDFELYSVG